MNSTILMGPCTACKAYNISRWTVFILIVSSCCCCWFFFLLPHLIEMVLSRCYVLFKQVTQSKCRAMQPIEPINFVRWITFICSPVYTFFECVFVCICTYMNAMWLLFIWNRSPGTSRALTEPDKLKSNKSLKPYKRRHNPFISLNNNTNNNNNHNKVIILTVVVTLGHQISDIMHIYMTWCDLSLVLTEFT